MNATKTRRNVVSLPANFCNVLDNMVDDKMICNRTDALKQIILEQHNLHPDKVVFTEKLNSTSLPKWLSQANMDTIKSILKESDDANEQHAMIVLDKVRTALKAWEEVGFDGLRELRAMRSTKKKAGSHKGTKASNLCTCGHPESDHYDNGGCYANEGRCDCAWFTDSGVAGEQ